MGIRSWTVVVLAVALPAGLAAQGLGDAAKKEKARRSQSDPSRPPAKTYTESDAKTLPPAANEADAAKPSATRDDSTSSAAGGGEERMRQQDEQRWRSRVATANERLASAQRRYDTLASMNLVPGYVYQDENGRTVIGSVEQLQGMTARAKAALESAQKALDDLLEEARRANVPPGWLR